MRILIVDDERPARDKLHRMLRQEPDVGAIEEARDGVEALEKLATFAPDLLLLDIQMPEISGLDVAASLPAAADAGGMPAPLVVFVTAYDAYAVRAFDANAIDYLLKPFDRARLQRALQRARERLARPTSLRSPLVAPDMPDALDALQMRDAADLPVVPAGPAGAVGPAGPAGTAGLVASVAPLVPVAAATGAAPPAASTVPMPPVHQLLVPERAGTRVVRVAQLAWIETADNYVLLHTPDGAFLMRQTLSGLLASLGQRFVRCHRRIAVQLDWITGLQALAKGDGEVLLRSGARVPYSRQYRDALVASLQAQMPAGGR